MTCLYPIFFQFNRMFVFVSCRVSEFIGEKWFCGDYRISRRLGPPRTKLPKRQMH